MGDCAKMTSQVEGSDPGKYWSKVKHYREKGLNNCISPIKPPFALKTNQNINTYK